MECFVVYKNEIEGRIDPFYYRREFREFEKKLSKIRVVSFGQIIKNIINGFDYRKFADNGLIYLRVSNIKPFEFELTDVKKINPSFPINKNIKLKKGDLLLTRKGTYGVALNLDKDYNYIISSEIFRIELSEDVNPKFIEIILNSSIGQKQFNKHKIGGIMGSLSQEAVRQIKIPLPPLSVQNRIVQLMDKAYQIKKSKETEAKKLLDSIDDYVLSELGIKLPELKDQMAFVVYADDVKGKRIDAYYYQSKFEMLRNIYHLSNFNLVKLDEICHIDWGNTSLTKAIYKEDGEYPVFSAAGNDGFADFYEKEGEAIILSAIGAKCGRTFYAQGKWVAIKNTIILRPKNDKVNAFYLYVVLNNEVIWEKSGGAQPFITIGSAKNLKIPLPPLKTQNIIAEEVKKRMQKAEQLQKEAKEVLEKAKQEVENIILNGEAYEG